MKKPKARTYKRGIVFKPGDILKIPFGGEKHSVFEVVKANKRKNILMVRVLEDYYKGNGDIQVGRIVDIGKMVFERYWFFTIKKA